MNWRRSWYVKFICGNLSLLALVMLVGLVALTQVDSEKSNTNVTVAESETNQVVLAGTTPNWDGVGAHPGSYDSSGCSSQVSSGQSIQTAVNASSSGNTVCVGSGNYGDQTVTVSVQNLTLVAAGDAIVGRVNIMTDDVTLEGFDITSTSLDGDQYGVFIDGSNAEVLNNHVYDTTSYGLNCENEESNNCSGLHLHHNTFERNSSIGVETWGSNVLIEYNVISDPTDDPDCCDTDTLRVMAGSNQTIRGNYMYIGSEPGTTTDDHPDCIMMFDSATAYYQGWTINTDVLIEGNICKNDAPGEHNGFILAGRNEHLSENFIIRNNICDHNGGTCYFISDVDNVAIHNNLCTQRSGVCVSNDRVNNNMVVKNNIDEPGVLEFIRRADENGLTQSNNLETTLSYQASNSPSYIGSYFYTSTSSTLNAGDNSVSSGDKDINYKTRVVESAIDIGPFEKQANSPSDDPDEPDSNPEDTQDSEDSPTNDNNSGTGDEPTNAAIVELEVAGSEEPSDTDANGDGIDDTQQNNVASAKNPLTNGMITLQTAGDCAEIRSFEIVQESDIATPDDTYDYPLGLNSFKLKCEEAGQNAEIQIVYDKQYQNSEWLLRKFLPHTDTYLGITDRAQIGERPLGSKQVTYMRYKLTDGGPLDGDGKADGAITDPAGFAAQADDATSQGTSPSSPGWSPWLVVIAATLIGSAIGVWFWWQRRRKQTSLQETHEAPKRYLS